MTAGNHAPVLNELRRRRVEIRRHGDMLRLHGPKGAIDPNLLEEVRAHKPDLLAWLGHRDRLAEMSLDEFSRQESAIEIRVHWLPETLWFVPGVSRADALVGQGVPRGRIWTAGELADLASVPGVTREDIRNLARLKAGFGAEIVSVTPDTDERDG